MAACVDKGGQAFYDSPTQRKMGIAMDLTQAEHRYTTIGCHSLWVCFAGRGPMTRPAEMLENGMMAGFEFSTDIESLFPYLNGLVRGAQLHDNPVHIRFHYEDVLCVLYGDKGFATPFDDHQQARSFIMRLILFLNDVQRNRKEITPSHKRFTHTAVPGILKLLPQTNCRACGFNSCLAFAAMLSRQQALPSQCPYMEQPVRERAVFPVYDAQGNQVSTLSLDVDYSENRTALASANAQIQQLERALTHLKQQRKEEQEQANQALPTPLSPREIQVLKRLARGETNPDISRELELSPHTVKSHITHIFNKLGVNSRAQASAWASRHEFV